MSYILVTLTIILVLSLTVAAAFLGGERVFPARRVIEYVSVDGIGIAGAVEPAHVLSDEMTLRELKRIRFATALAGYNKDEVEQFVQLLIDENAALRKQLDQQGASATTAKTTAEDHA